MGSSYKKSSYFEKVKPGERLKTAIYWGASCGGCEIAFLEIAERILEFVEKCQLVFCPCLMDVKYC